MINTATSINHIITYIFSEQTIYDDIINKVIGKYFDQKPELISTLALQFLENPNKLIQAYNSNYFEYWFIRVVKNQLYSNTSLFQKDIKINESYFNENMNQKEDTDLEEKEIKEAQFDLLDKALESLNVPWFDAQIFSLYYRHGLSYRQIEKEVKIDHSLAFQTVKRVKTKIKNYIKNKNNKNIFNSENK